MTKIGLVSQGNYTVNFYIQFSFHIDSPAHKPLWMKEKDIVKESRQKTAQAHLRGKCNLTKMKKS